MTKHETITTAASSPPNDAHLPKSPSSFNMLRGVESHESEDISKNVNISHNQYLSTREESFSARMKNAFIGSNAGVGGCIPTTAMSNMNTATNKMEETGEDDLYSIIADVPFFPPEHHREEDQSRERRRQQERAAYREEELVVDFPQQELVNENQSSSHHQEIKIAQHQHQNMQSQHPSEQSPKHNSLEEQPNHTFPGFALYNNARVYYILGQYTKALDTTTECLAFQKKALLINNNHDLNNASIKKNDGSSPTGFGVGVRSFLSSSSSTVPNFVSSDTSMLLPNAHNPIVVANSTTKILSQYPSHACVAQTLLLRARVLAVCGLYGHDDCDNDEHSSPAGRDRTLVYQAIQHVEMAVAIQRKISTFTNVNIDLTQWELAIPMVLLGFLKVEVQCFEEANSAYEEALLILRSVRQLHDDEKQAALQREDQVIARQHLKVSKRITKEMANVFYLKGRSFQCRRLYNEAFDCYNKGLNFLTKVGASKYSAGTRRIIRCMRKSSALEKLLSDFWDDPNRI